MNIRCKMCGAAVQVNTKEHVVVCEYCGSSITLPSLEDETKTLLYNRANQSRLRSEFDNAYKLFEDLLKTNPEDPEIYWSLLLCRYGIEYVKDPKTDKFIPTCHRTLMRPIYEDEDYQDAIKYASPEMRKIYEQEAVEIDHIQQATLRAAKDIPPFDIFICYKETDEFDNRTVDSVLAQNLYDKLTGEGYHVFYSRETLKEIPGEAYEPYIYAALRSSRIMIIVGTCPEFLYARWVKNEWSRFISFMEKGEKKYPIVAYKGMNPREIPVELAHSEALDMNAIGFVEDLLRGVRRIFEGKVTNSNTLSTGGFLEAGFLAVATKEYEKAANLFQMVITLDSSNPYAYLGMIGAVDEEKREIYYQKFCEFSSKRSQENEQQYLKLLKANIERVLYCFIDHNDILRIEECIATDTNMNKGLCYAVQKNQKEVVRCLCNVEGISLDALVNDGTACAVSIACDEKNEEMVEFLLENGASPNIIFENEEHTDSDTLLSYCIRNDYLGGIRILLEKGASVSERFGVNQRTILSFAINNSQRDICELLIKYGADINEFSCGIPTFAYAVFANTEMISFIIDQQADLDLCWKANDTIYNIVTYAYNVHRIEVLEYLAKSRYKYLIEDHIDRLHTYLKKKIYIPARIMGLVGCVIIMILIVENGAKTLIDFIALLGFGAALGIPSGIYIWSKVSNWLFREDDDARMIRKEKNSFERILNQL